MSNRDGLIIRRRTFAQASAAPFVVSCLASLMLLACVDPDEGGVPDAFEPENASTTGTSGELSYPLGPYGVTRGQVIQDFAFTGFANPVADSGTLVPLRLGDFFNPTGDGVFPEGSPYGAGLPKPLAVGIVVGAVWCSPCKEEARAMLPEQYERLKPQGGELFFVLSESSKPGVPASQGDLVNWTKTFDTNFPSVLDADHVLSAVVKADSYPGNIIIDTRTMAIVDVVTGSPPASYWDTFEAVLRGE